MTTGPVPEGSAAAVPSAEATAGGSSYLCSDDDGRGRSAHPICAILLSSVSDGGIGESRLRLFQKPPHRGGFRVFGYECRQNGAASTSGGSPWLVPPLLQA